MSTQKDEFDFELRGKLAAALKCWHRLTESEADNLISFVRDMEANQQKTEKACQVLRDALKKLMGHVGNIEVLGEWSALEINANKAEVLRQQVVAVVNECEAAINPTGGKTP